LLSGFHCYFDSDQLVRGENRFAYTIELSDSTTMVDRLVTLDTKPDRQSVTDVFIDIVGPCNLRCAMCPQGVLEERSGERGSGFMPVSLFARTLTFLQRRQAIGAYVNLYNWGDPLLHPKLGEILDICHAKRIEAIISTNLSFPLARVREMTRHHVRLLIVSLSGFTERTYAQNHVRGNFRRVRDNLDELAKDRGQVAEVLVKYLVFQHNRGELEAAKAFCRAAGFRRSRASCVIRRIQLTAMQSTDSSTPNGSGQRRRAFVRRRQQSWSIIAANWSDVAFRGTETTGQPCSRPTSGNIWTQS
jgi:pyruvate-formate lyase-activating enzyme